MGFQIATNIGALKAYNALSSLNARTQKAQLRLATQKRINSVADDTSGFNVGKSLDQKVKLMQAAQGNVGSAKDMLATAESQLISIKDWQYPTLFTASPNETSSGLASQINITNGLGSTNTNELTPQFIEYLKQQFKNYSVDIIIKEQSETDYLNSSKKNKEYLEEAIKEVENMQLINKTLKELDL